MQIAIDPKKEEILQEIAKKYKKSLSQIVEESIDKIILQYKLKKTEDLAKDVVRRYEEAIKSDEKKDAWKLLDEL